MDKYFKIYNFFSLKPLCIWLMSSIFLSHVIRGLLLMQMDPMCRPNNDCTPPFRRWLKRCIITQLSRSLSKECVGPSTWSQPSPRRLLNQSYGSSTMEIKGVFSWRKSLGFGTVAHSLLLDK